jgi:hypothetical protein
VTLDLFGKRPLPWNDPAATPQKPQKPQNPGPFDAENTPQPGDDPRGGVPPGTEKNISPELPGATPEGAVGVDDPATPPTLAEYQEEARWVCSLLPEGDADRRDLEALIEVAGSGDDDDLTRLGVRTVEVYGRRIDPKYRAAIWGGRTWGEVTEGRRRG